MSHTCMHVLFIVAIVVGTVQGASFHGFATSKHTVTPIEKVIELLSKLMTKVEAEGKAEASAYDKFACFCKEQADNKLYQIEKSQSRIALLNATIDDLAAKVTVLADNMYPIKKDIYWNEVDLEDETFLRQAKHKKYLESIGGLSESIASIKGAIKALEDSKGEMKGDVELNLAQVHAVAGSALSNLQRSNITDVANTSEAMVAFSQFEVAAQPHSYEYQSNDILSTLKSLKDTFIKKKNDVDTEEFESKARFEVKKMDLEHKLKLLHRELDETEEEHDRKAELLQKAEEDKSQESYDMNADQSFLDVLTSDCEKKAKLWDQRSKARAAELTALSKATDMLKEKGAPAYSANKKLVGVQTQKAISFLQMQDQNVQIQMSLQMLATRKAEAILQQAANKLSSSTLLTVAMRIRLSKDHFVKVRTLIKDLLSRLKEDAKNEAEQKSFCDKEMGKAITSRDKANAGIEDSDAKITKFEVEKETLTQEVVDLSSAISADKKALREELELRTKEKLENTEIITTAKEGEEAVDFALSVLKEFYEGAAAGLIQYVPPNSDREGNTVADLAPKTFDEEYKGSQQESTGILGILEVVKSDFDRTITATEDAEKTAQEDFDTFEEDTKNDIKEKDGFVKAKNDRISEIEDELNELANTLREFEALKETAMEGLNKLKDMCVKSTESYEERVAKRKSEIQALKEANEILENSQR